MTLGEGTVPLERCVDRPSCINLVGLVPKGDGWWPGAVYPAGILG